ncbi:MAM domain-containing glycosylphosphatidylinositol anchor protein 2-like [Antedon mediterranea]|uniref:MAM domain-containing glycosylphosphatidylinositol anchor protein 2-like n=1 Tax=Antedon mediterranea TaxID=105859 RepID=UPI003AF7A9B8
MYGSTIGTLNVYRTSKLGDELLWSRNGTQGNVWHAGTVQFAHNGYGDNYIVFEGIGGRSYTGDIAIDDIYLGETETATASFEKETDTATASFEKEPVEETNLAQNIKVFQNDVPVLRVKMCRPKQFGNKPTTGRESTVLH